MADTNEIMEVVTDNTAEVVEDVVTEKVKEGIQINNLEAGLGLAAAAAVGFGIAKLIDFVKAKKAQKPAAEESEKNPGFFGKMFGKGKKAVETVKEEVTTALTEETTEEK